MIISIRNKILSVSSSVFEESGRIEQLTRGFRIVRVYFSNIVEGFTW